MQDRAWWIRLPDGSRRRLDPAGVLVGRDPDCDLVLRDPGASRRQMLLYVSVDGPQVVPLGRAATRVAGQSVSSAALVEHGYLVQVPGLDLVVEAEGSEPTDDPDPVWVVERLGGELFGVGLRGVSVGSGPADDVRIEECPAGAISYRVAQGRLVLEANVPVQVAGRPIEAGTVESLRSGDRVSVGDVTFRVLAGGRQGLDSTMGVGGGGDITLPESARLVFLPRGGRLTIRIDGRERSTYLADRRCDLVACLLNPPAPFMPGEPVPDEVLLARLWPRRDVSGGALNVLLHRLRRDLVRAGIDGSEIVARPPGGGAVRFSLRRGAQVEVV